MKAPVTFLAGMVWCGSSWAQINSPTNTTTSTNTNPVTATTAATVTGGGTVTNPSATGGQGGASGSSSVSVTTGSQTTTYPANQSITSVPAIYVPSLGTGNICAVGVSAGASWLGAGFAVGTAWESMQCERRQAAALLWNMGTPESRATAKEVLCNSPEIRQAYQTAGHPCARDMAKVEGPAKSTAITKVNSVQFDPGQYRSASDCLTAAHAASAPLSVCAGKP
jgi:hypothetical protein